MYQNQILVNRASSCKVKGSSIRQLVEEHLTSNLAHAYGKFYKQTVGIPQGSVLSTMFCSLYLANLEVNKLFPILNINAENTETLKFHLKHSKVIQISQDEQSKESSQIGTGTFPSNELSSHSRSSPSENKRQVRVNSTILRFVDDYLYITTSEEDAKRFLDTMHTGFPEYNCYMNKKKTSLNFSVDGDEESYKRNLWVDGLGSAFLKWCGLLINVKTFEIQADYTRIQGSVLRESMNIGPEQPGKALKSKLCWYLRFRCNFMLFDTVINSPKVVRLNIYQAFVVCAMKCHLMVSRMVHSPSLENVVLDAIEGAQMYMIYKVRHALGVVEQQMQRPSYGSYRHRFVKKIPDHHIKWLGTMAFLKILRRKQTKYTSLISRLERQLKSTQFRQLSVQLSDVVDPQLSSILESVQY